MFRNQNLVVFACYLFLVTLCNCKKNEFTTTNNENHLKEIR